MKMIITLVVALSMFSGAAQAANKSEVWELMERIDSELRHYNQNPETLELVKAKLEEALRAMRGGPIDNPQACTDFTFEEFRKDGFSNSISMDKARAFCEKLAQYNGSLVVIQYLYAEMQKDGYSKSVSLNLSLELSRKVSEEKLPCVRSAYERYSRDGFSKRTSLEKAAGFCA